MSVGRCPRPTTMMPTASQRDQGVPRWKKMTAAIVASTVLAIVYASTAAPDLTFWDAGELTTAAHTLGIPHPPGIPLWVLMGRVTSIAFHWMSPARAITMLSVLAGALTGGAGAWMATRWIGTCWAIMSALLAGTFYTVWSNATETEVYATALLASVLLLLVGERAGRHGIDDNARARLRGLMAFMAGTAVPLHLSVLVVLPASLLFAWTGPPPRLRDYVSWVSLFLLGISAVAVLPLLAARNPALNAGNPVSLEALIAVLRREQYQVAGLWPRQAPLWLQLGNVLQWADWQAAMGLQPLRVPSVPRTALTLIYGALGVMGLRLLFRYEPRAGRAMLLLVTSSSFGVALWLNMHLGPSFGGSFAPEHVLREARERDYFFALAFWTWGILAGAGLSALSTGLHRYAPSHWALFKSTLVGSAVFLPAAINLSFVDRREEPAASLPRTFARLLLDAVPENGVLMTAGDNDTFPLWYLQIVEKYREDVQVVAVPLLGASWYRASIEGEQLLQPAMGGTPRMSAVLRSIMIKAGEAGRPVRVSALLEHRNRIEMDPRAGWALEGLVYAPSFRFSAGSTGLDLAVMRRGFDRTPRAALVPLPVGADPALGVAQDLLRCGTIERLSDSLLVLVCNGF